MDELPGNSNRAKAQAETPEPAPNGKVSTDPEVVEKIIQGKVVERKKPLGKRFIEAFTGDSARAVGEYLLHDILLSSLRDLVSDLITQGTERALYGEKRSETRRNLGRGGSTRPYFNYNGISRPGYRPDPREESRNRARDENDFGMVIFDRRSDADDVLERMFDRIEEYNEVTLSYFKGLVGKTAQYTDQRWGWTDIEKAKVVRYGSDGYIIELPKLEHLPHNR